MRLIKLSLISIFLVLSYLRVEAQNTLKKEINSFTEETHGTVSLHRSTRTPNFIRIPREEALNLDGVTLEQKAHSFLQTHGKLWGVQNSTEELIFKEEKTDHIGHHRLVLVQNYQGIPIYDGRLQFHFNAQKELTAVNGHFIPSIKINPNPSFTATKASGLAIAHVINQQENYTGKPLIARKITPYIFQKGLVQGIEGAHHLVYEVEVANEGNIREFVFIDAHKGILVDQFTGNHSALFRRVYEENTSVQVWQEGDGFPGTLDQWQQNEVITAEDVYYFFLHAFGFDSYDDAGAEMRTINNDPTILCPNANWNGSTANFCSGTAADDIIAHEWSHAYVEYTANLIYQWQSGALNESYADIWGETIDLINGYEDAGEDFSLRTACNSSDRWRMGEDAPLLSGPIRDLWSPTCDGDPGKVSDTDYWCSQLDNGGVHVNSGINNHLYALLVDGGTYNGYTIDALGMEKAAHIFWRAQSIYLTPTSDFNVQADALEAACADLVGFTPNLLTTEATPAGTSGKAITTTDCQEVAEAILAVELRTDPSCIFLPLFDPVSPLCQGADAANAIFFEDFETGASAWVATEVPTNPASWDTRNWQLTSSLPNGRTGTGFYGPDPIIGDCTTDLNNGIIRLESPLITIPSTTSGSISLAFDHYVSMENEWDGGQVYYSLNGGTWTLLPSTAFKENAYNDQLNTVGQGNDNPVAGQDAFTGADGGSLSCVWGQSQVNLSSIGVVANSTLQLRWEVSTDGCNGWDGWYLDDVRVYTCVIPAVSFTTESSTINESDAVIDNACLDYIQVKVTLQIEDTPSQPVTVTLNPATGSALQGTSSDFSITPNTVTLDAANLTQDIIVRVYDDAIFEGNETAVLSYTLNANGGNAIASVNNQNHTITIIDDDFAPTSRPTVLLSEDFEGGLGAFTSTTTGTVGFKPGTTAIASSTYWFIENTNTGQFAYVNDDDCNCDMSEVRLISPSFSLVGADGATLTFDHAFSDQGETFDVLVSIDGGTTWSPSIQNITNTSTVVTPGTYSTPWVNGVVVDLSAYLNKPDVRVAFEYNDGNAWKYGATVDNVSVIIAQPVSIQTVVNTATPQDQFLGANETISFYDPTTGDIMMDIENLSSFDYGCTSVSVTRAGTAAAEAWNPMVSNYIASKTFRVSPSNNNPAGSYQITLYYTDAEIAGWEGVTGRNRSELVLVKTGQNLTNPQASDTREEANATQGTLGVNYTYSAIFNTGFSDFGVGPTESILPVELVGFTGRYTASGIFLNWQTASEINSDRFELERSENGIDFSKITTTRAAGNSATPRFYEYLDQAHFLGENYYRLKAIDLDGSFIYSEVILINATLPSNYFAVHPNPAISMTKIKLGSAFTEQVRLNVYDILGKKLYTESLDLVPGINSFELDVQNWSGGIYLLEIVESRLQRPAIRMMKEN